VTAPATSRGMAAPFRQAMVLAAGTGIRMRPLTEDRAKPSLPLMNRPMILHALDLLHRHGVENVVVNLHHLPGTLTGRIAAASYPRMEISTSIEPVILGTGGGIAAALGRFDRSLPLLVVNADSLAAVDLARLAADHAAASRAGAPVTLAVIDHEGTERYSPIQLDGAGLVSGIGSLGTPGRAGPASGAGGPEGPAGTGAICTFIGVHVLSPEALAAIPASGASDTVRDLYLPWLREGRRLGAHRHGGWWIEAGSPALYRDSHVRLLREPEFLESLPPACGFLAPGSPPSLVGPGCEGLEGARIQASVLGPRCRLGEECSVARSVLAEGARVGRGATIEDAVVWEGVDVPEGAVVRGMLLMPGSGPGSTPRQVPL